MLFKRILYALNKLHCIRQCWLPNFALNNDLIAAAHYASSLIHIDNVYAVSYIHLKVIPIADFDLSITDHILNIDSTDIIIYVTLRGCEALRKCGIFRVHFSA